MSDTNFALSTWRSLTRFPAGNRIFSWIVCWKAPYFSSIRPVFETLRPNFCEVRMKKRRRVQNHIKTVHAIAMCNLAEIAAGTLTEVTVPATHRWIPRGMTVEYLAKATTNLRAVAEIDPEQEYGDAVELPVTVAVFDTSDQIVFRAIICMWVTTR